MTKISFWRSRGFQPREPEPTDFQSVVFQLQNAYTKIEKSFNLVKVYDGCFNACNIYKLEL